MRRILALLTVLLTGLLTLAWPVPAHAETGRRFDELRVTYDVRPDATVNVTYALHVAFGSGPRHGISFRINTREPWDPNPAQNVVYRVEDLRVSSPTGAPATFTTSTARDGDREDLVLKIGEESTTVDPTETYVITYRLQGALRTFTPGTSELYVDVTGPGYPPISRSVVTVTAPGQARDPKCTARATSCDTTTVPGGYGFSTGPLAEGDVLTVATQFPELAGARPELVRARSQVERGLTVANLVGLPLVVAGLLGGATWLSRRRRPVDERFVGTPVGVVAPQGTPTEPARPIEVPVRLEPPECSLEEAALLRGKPARALPARLAKMAYDGTLRLQRRPLRVERAGSRPAKGLEAQLWDAAAQPSADADLARSSLRSMASICRAAGANRAQLWTTNSGQPRLRGAAGKAVGVLLAAAGAAVGAALVGWTSFAGLLTMFVLPLTVPYAAKRYSRTGAPGRSALGTALHQQVTGFATYLRTAEADQLRFEEDHDIFTRYLPWAIVFGCADRWAQVCEDAAGRAGVALPAPVIDGQRGWSDYENAVTQAAPFSTEGSGRDSAGSGGSASSGGSGGHSSSSGFSSGGGAGGTGADTW